MLRHASEVVLCVDARKLQDYTFKNQDVTHRCGWHVLSFYSGPKFDASEDSNRQKTHSNSGLESSLWFVKLQCITEYRWESGTIV
jgi:hypothetical protein